jgi:hypothetical protein
MIKALRTIAAKSSPASRIIEKWKVKGIKSNGKS